MNTPNQNPDDSFDQALENDAEELSGIAQKVLEEDEVKQGLVDEDRDDAW